MEKYALHLGEHPTFGAQSLSHPLSRRDFVSFLSLGSIFGVGMNFAKGQAVKEEQRDVPSVEVVHTRVFSAGPNGGNPCPVIPSADHLDDRAMQAFSRKFKLDTVFILNPQSKDADIRLRYFVPEHEIGVSGHATIAAITVAVRDRKTPLKRIRVETLNGIFAVYCVEQGEHLLVTLEQNRPTFGAAVPVSMVAAALRISNKTILDATPVESVSVSRPKLLVPLVDSGVLDKLAPDFEVLWTLCDSFQVTGIYPFTRNTDKRNAEVEARQFPLRAGFAEDAATGVAAGALAAYLVKYDRKLRTGEHRFRIAQGYAMGAPSLIEVLVDCEEGSITRTAIRGEADIIRRELTTVQ